jgi:hypothetical protein
MPRSPRWPLAVALSLALLAPVRSAAAVAVRTSVEELARSSAAVVRGKVERKRSYWAGPRIHTEVEVRSSEVWRGDAPPVVKVTVPGGVVGDIGQRVDAAPSFRAGEEVVVFLSSTAGRHAVNGLMQGKFSVDGAVARPALGDATLLPRSLRAGERAVEEMSLAELERRVKEAR